MMNHVYELQTLFSHFRLVGELLLDIAKERGKPGYLQEVFPHIPADKFPKYGTKAYWLLVLLSDGQAHDIWVIWLWLASPAGPRSPLQTLTNERGHQLWLINNLSEKGKPAVYQLDIAHLNGSALDDELARIECLLKYLENSENLGDNAAKKLPEVRDKKRRLLEEHPNRYGQGPAKPLPNL